MLALDAVFRQLGFQFIPPRLKAIGNVLEKEQTEDNMLVLGGINLPAQGVGRFPEGIGVREIGNAFVAHTLRALQCNWRCAIRRLHGFYRLRCLLEQLVSGGRQGAWLLSPCE